MITDDQELAVVRSVSAWVFSLRLNCTASPAWHTCRSAITEPPQDTCRRPSTPPHPGPVNARSGAFVWPRTIKAGEIAEGCSVLTSNFREIDGPTSTRERWKLDTIEQHVRSHATVPEVKEFVGLRTKHT
ncbi:hypothetical protein [Nocardia sp. NPDC047038]|uniref:hypothetical protein n=1 Tax=Nocardia sp. NPDC047038 TaxID=3154338 RepID=UPI00340F714F